MMKIAFYDTKPYDREYFARVARDMQFNYLECRLSVATVNTAQGADAVCVFVNDRLDRPCLEALQKMGVRHVALRCAGFNNVDCAAAKALGLTVSRVPAYSPHAVAEHALALLLTLNRKIHRAHNRVREQNFSLNGLVGFDLYGKTAGILGTGKIGKIAAEIVKGFGMKVLAFDAMPDEAWAKSKEVIYAPLKDVLAQSDVVSLHMPLVPETYRIINSTPYI